MILVLLFHNLLYFTVFNFTNYLSLNFKFSLRERKSASRVSSVSFLLEKLIDYCNILKLFPILDFDASR